VAAGEADEQNKQAESERRQQLTTLSTSVRASRSLQFCADAKPTFERRSPI